MQTISVQTTQNVAIQYQVANLGDRIIAYILDRIIIISYVVLVFFLLDRMNANSEWAYVALAVVPYAFYHLLFEIFMNGQSPGKLIMNIKVVRLDGSEPTVGNYLMRWMLSLVDFYLVTGAVAIVVIASNGKGQRVGDIAAGTTVVKLTRVGNANATFLVTEDDYDPKFPEVVQLSDRDIERAKQIAAYPWFRDKKPWQREIKRMLQNGFKMEVESLITKDISYVTEVYVPERLAQRDFLD